MEGKNFYHISTDGTSAKIIFRNDMDYIKGMNYIPVCMSGLNGISMYCFCLMSNHVHFIVRGSYEECAAFIKKYKRRVSYQLSSAFDADASIKEIGNPDYLERAIAYVLRNPVAARLPVTPLGYRWSSAGLYFRQTAPPPPGTRRLSSLSTRELRNRLNTHITLSGYMNIGADGMIIPDGYVDIQSVERLFRTPSHFMFMLSKNEDLEMELTSDILRKTRYADNELFSSMLSLIKIDFEKTGLDELPIEQKLQLAAKLKAFFSSITKLHDIKCKGKSRMTDTG